MEEAVEGQWEAEIWPGMDSDGPRLVEGKSCWLHPALAAVEMADKGRGVVAQTAVAEGALGAAETPLAACLLWDQSHCDECGRPVGEETAPEECAGCQETWCSVDCRRRAAVHHWLECRQPFAVVGAPGGIYCLCFRIYLSTPAGLRDLWERRKRPSQPDTPLSEMLASEEDRVRLSASLPDHRESNRSWDAWPDVVRRVKFLSKAIRARFLAAEGACSPSRQRIQRQLLHVLMVGYTNTFTVYRQLEPAGLGSTPCKVVGSGLYPAVSLLNHSCLPNTTRHFDGTKMVMRAIRALVPGEELTTTYGTNPKYQLTYQRREALHTWRFVCGCAEACGNADWKTPEAEY